MKKIMALLLAATLAIGTASVAFAAGNPATADRNEQYLAVDLGNVYKMNDDDKVVDNSPVSFGDAIEPGTTLYFKLDGAKATQDGVDVFDSGIAGVKTFSNVSDLSDYRISYSISDGKSMVKSAKFVKAKASSDNKSHLYLALEMNDNFIMEETSLDMTLKVSSKNGAYIGTSKTGSFASNGVIETDISATLSYDIADVGNGYYTVNSNGAVLSFDDDADDVILCFDEDVEVSGNMKGQKDIFVRLSTSNDAIEDKYPDATVRFFDGNKDTFKRDVNVKIPYESAVEKPYLYEVSASGALTKVSGAKYDDVAGEFNFTTKTLGNYLLSDTELKSTTTDAPSTDVPSGDKPSDGTQPNPGTGANDFVGLAVALAVVSAAGIAVAKRNK